MNCLSWPAPCLQLFQRRAVAAWPSQRATELLRSGPFAVSGRLQPSNRHHQVEYVARLVALRFMRLAGKLRANSVDIGAERGPGCGRDLEVVLAQGESHPGERGGRSGRVNE